MTFWILLITVAVAWYLLSKSNQQKDKPPQISERHHESKEAIQIRSALQFAQNQHASLKAEADSKIAWQIQHGNRKISQLDSLSGIEFEEYLAGFFKRKGYAVETTAISGDFGADLILIQDKKRIAVQAKRWKDMVGVAAVQEVLAGKAYYQCNAAWVVTTSRFTKQAIELAAQSEVKLISRRDLALLMGST